MRINEVEKLVGITKGNIRFYEKEGLLTPGREGGNGYRDYSGEDVAWLKKIRLLRMLDVPVGEIARLKSGALTLEDAMARHIIQLERQQKNLAAMQSVCAGLRDSRQTLERLDADAALEHMQRQEQEGTRFMDVTRQDRKVKYVAPVVAAALMMLFMGAFTALLGWAIWSDPEIPRWTLVFLAAPAALIVGVAVALVQRFKQIRGGEEDAAAQY